MFKASIIVGINWSLNFSQSVFFRMAKTRRHSLHQKVLEKVFEVNLMEICVKPLFEKPSRGFCWRWILTRTYFMHSTWMQQLESFVSACEFVWQTCATLSVYGRRLMFERSQVRILALYTGWTWHFSHWFVVKFVLFVWKRLKINEKEAGFGPFFFNKSKGFLCCPPLFNEKFP